MWVCVSVGMCGYVCVCAHVQTDRKEGHMLVVSVVVVWKGAESGMYG